MNETKVWAVYKTGTGTLGRVCGNFGTWKSETRDLGTLNMGRGDAGMRLLQKSEGNAISVTFLVNMFW